MNHAKEWYRELRKPPFAPPAWIFAPVWTALYIVIAISFSFVAYKTYHHLLPISIFVLFVANLVTNLAYSPIQFRLRNLTLATIDILLVLVSLAFALYSVNAYYPWVAWANLPYLAWVSFATILQLSITFLNRHA